MITEPAGTTSHKFSSVAQRLPGTTDHGNRNGLPGKRRIRLTIGFKGYTRSIRRPQRRQDEPKNDKGIRGKIALDPFVFQ